MSKFKGKVVTQAGLIFLWRDEEISDAELIGGTISIWGDEFFYIAAGRAVMSPAFTPIFAAYVASKIIEDPEEIWEDYGKYYLIQSEYLPPPINPTELSASKVGYTALMEAHKVGRELPGLWRKFVRPTGRAYPF